MIYLLITVGVMILDRITKILTVSHFSGIANPDDTALISITYVKNTGAAFSMLQGHSTLLIVFPAIIIAVALIFMIVKSKSYKPIFLISLALICGGGLGNLTDRLAYGYVVDMISVGDFPVFNVADISVCVGCGLLLLYMIIYENKNVK